MSESSGNQTFSDVVARRIVLLRKRRDMTRDQLAAACAALGYPDLTGPAIANIETGRRLPNGQRRREVSVDEVAVISRALKVAPLVLLFPIGEEEAMPLYPGFTMPTWDAAQWFRGSAYVSGEEAEHWAVPIYLFDQHDRILGSWGELEIDGIWSPTEVRQDPEKLEQARGVLKQRLRSLRADMRRHGLTPPTLPPGLEDIDQVRHTPLSPADVDRIIAEGGEVRLVDYSRGPGQGYVVKSGEDAERLNRQVQDGLRKLNED